MEFNILIGRFLAVLSTDSGDCLTTTSGLCLGGTWPNMSPASTYAKSSIKLLLDEADAGSLKLSN